MLRQTDATGDVFHPKAQLEGLRAAGKEVDLTQFVHGRLADIQKMRGLYGKLGVTPPERLHRAMVELYELGSTAQVESHTAYQVLSSLFPTPMLRRAAQHLDSEDRQLLLAEMQETDRPSSETLRAMLANGSGRIAYATRRQALFTLMAREEFRPEDILTYGRWVGMEESQLHAYLQVAMNKGEDRARWSLYTRDKRPDLTALDIFLRDQPTVAKLLEADIDWALRPISLWISWQEPDQALVSSVGAQIERFNDDVEAVKAVADRKDLLNRLSPRERLNASDGLRELIPQTTAFELGQEIESIAHRPIGSVREMGEALVRLAAMQLGDSLAERRETIQWKIRQAHWRVPPTIALPEEVKPNRKQTVDEFLSTEKTYAEDMARLAKRNHAYAAPVEEMRPFQDKLRAAATYEEPQARHAALINAFQTPEYARYIAAHVPLIALYHQSSSAQANETIKPVQRVARLPLLAGDLARRTPEESPLKADATAMLETAQAMAAILNAATTLN
jgi:hypothetical protein